MSALEVNIDSFCFKTWVHGTYPCENDADEKQKLIDYLCVSLSKHNMQLYSSQVPLIIDLLGLISHHCSKGASFESEDIDTIAIESICSSLNRIVKSILHKNVRGTIEMSNGYYLNVDSIPSAIRFWKYLMDNNYLKNRRMSRSMLENYYKDFPDNEAKFSYILFCLSWLNCLRVYNNNQIYLNPRNNLIF